MDHDYRTVRIDDRGEGLLLLTLSRPEVANAMNTQMGRDLLAFFDAINAAPAKQRCIVVTGAGERAFCAGGDLKERNGMTDEAWQDQHLLFEHARQPVELAGFRKGYTVPRKRPDCWLVAHQRES